MKHFFILLLLAKSSMAWCQESIEVSIPYDNYKYAIKGTFLKAAKSTGTAALIIAGSGPTDRNCNGAGGQSNAYKFLAEHLASKGISSLRYDKLGVAYSVPGPPEQETTFENNVDVAFAVYDFLTQQEGVERVILIGHSEGSLVAILLAQRAQVEKLISLAGPAYPANEILKKQLSNLPAELKEFTLEKIDSLTAGQEIKEFKPELMSLFRPSVNKYLISWFSYDPRTEIAKLTVPILILQGDNDIQVSTYNANELSKASNNAKTVLCKDVNHVLKMAPRDKQENIAAYNTPDSDIAEEVKRMILDFILN